MKKTKVIRPVPLPLNDSLIIEGDALTCLRRLPDESVQTVITSPPYWGLRDYGVNGQIGLEETLPQFLNRLVSVFSEVQRVLKKDGILWVNIGDGYTSGNRGWRAPDKKNPNRAMTTRPKTPEGLKKKDMLAIPWRLALALQNDGWYLRSDIVWNKPNAMPESVTDRPTKSHEYLFMLTKSEKYTYYRDAVREQNQRNRRSVWNVNTSTEGHNHIAAFPPKLIEPCVLASTEEDDFILDPFFGSGTVGVVASNLRRRYIGIELHPDYISSAVQRLDQNEQKVIRINPERSAKTGRKAASA